MGRLFFRLACGILWVGCIASCQTRSQKALRYIAPGYAIYNTDNRFYTLQGPHSPGGARGGLLGGRVDSVGWNDTLILAYYHPVTPNDRGQWAIVNMLTRRTTGLLADSARALASTLPGHGVTTTGAAWRDLH
jgi:hypothetical protein